MDYRYFSDIDTKTKKKMKKTTKNREGGGRESGDGGYERARDGDADVDAVHDEEMGTCMMIKKSLTIKNKNLYSQMCADLIVPREATAG